MTEETNEEKTEESSEERPVSLDENESQKETENSEKSENSEESEYKEPTDEDLKKKSFKASYEDENSENYGDKEDNSGDDSDKFDFDDEYDEDKVEESKEEDNRDEELDGVREELKRLNQDSSRNKFPRVESKPEFASGALNTESVKRIANLQESEIYDLLQKRKFFNFLHFVGWGEIADKRVFPLIGDIEDYSLSKKGKLLDSVFIDRAKQESLNYEREPKGGKRQQK